MISTQLTTDPTVLRQRAMESLKKEILLRRRDLEPLMVTPKVDRSIDYRGSDSINSRFRRIL